MFGDWSPMPRTKRACAAGVAANAPARMRTETSLRTCSGRYAPRRSADARRRPPARRDRLAPLRPSARPRPPAVGDLPHARPSRRQHRAADEAPSRGGRRRLRQRDPQRPARPEPRGPRRPARRRAPEPVADAGEPRAARPRNAGPFAPAAPRAALDPVDAAERHRAPPRNPFNGPISPHRRFAFGQLSLDDVRALKDALGYPVNDVVVALSATAVRGWLLDRDALPEDPLVAVVPMSVCTEEERGAFGNRVSMMIVPIPTDEPDALRRLERTHELLRSAKERHKALPANLLTDATAFIPPAVSALAAPTAMQTRARTRPPVNLVISNVPGPRNPLFLAGARLQAMYPVSVVVDGVGLNITV